MTTLLKHIKNVTQPTNFDNIELTLKGSNKHYTLSKGSLILANHSLVNGTTLLKITTKFRRNITDQKRRKQFKQKELSLRIANSCIVSSFGSALGLKAIEYRKRYSSKFNKGSLTKVRNRCVLTGHSTAIHNLGLSRIMIRRLAHEGRLAGFTKRLNR